MIPFAGTAFHTDEPLFLWAAKQIVAHPMDPYGFDVVWINRALPMAEITKNPPLGSYFIALIASFFGWTEGALRIAFLLPAIAVVLGTHRLSQRFCRMPLLAGTATLLAPGFLVSANSVMCDTMMLAFWMWAVILWLDGLDKSSPFLLASSALLIGASALTKYFGMTLIPLLVVYSYLRKVRINQWVWYFLIPISMLFAYQFWTQKLYGRGLLLDAASYASFLQQRNRLSIIAKTLISLAFLGGCTMAGLLFAPWLWRTKAILIGCAVSVAAAMAIAKGWIHAGLATIFDSSVAFDAQVALFSAAGISVLALVINELRRTRNAETFLLSCWIFGTLVFAGFINWTINARSILPLIPAAAILLTRRLEANLSTDKKILPKLILPIAAQAIISILVIRGDAALANSARDAAAIIKDRTSNQIGMVWFQGHWGFQYYMQLIGAQPIDVQKKGLQAGDVVIIPENNANTFSMNSRFTEIIDTIEIDLHQPATTMNQEAGAGFYANVWGPLPYAFGKIPPERYQILRLKPLIVPELPEQ